VLLSGHHQFLSRLFQSLWITPCLWFYCLLSGPSQSYHQWSFSTMYPVKKISMPIWKLTEILSTYLW
jgi:hypothetical protein